MSTSHLKEVSGSKGFDANWRSRKETLNNYWIPGAPKNQIQLAFRMHWRLFAELLDVTRSGRCLEVGCGRGSASSFFAQAGFDCTLLDYSPSVLSTATTIFANNGHQGSFVCGDANALPFACDNFDIILSIGLLEHFEDIAPPLKEQYRVLKPGGLFLGYVVPERPTNIQRYFRWVNRILKLLALFGKSKASAPKTPIYRNDLGSERYLPVLDEIKAKDVQAFGVYPLPMISHSPEFPFSLMPRPIEWLLTQVFMGVLWSRRHLYGKNPWMCRESLGQAFLLVCRKG